MFALQREHLDELAQALAILVRLDRRSGIEEGLFGSDGHAGEVDGVGTANHGYVVGGFEERFVP